MRITLLSDTHLGFGSGTERDQDAFLAFEEAIARGLGSDLILLAGDVFDTRTPTPETFSRAMEILLKSRFRPTTIKISGIRKDLTNSVEGIPVIAIHGNHERRVKGLINPVEALERGGFLAHLHANGVLLERGGEKLAVQGMSAVPSQYAAEAFKEWSPRPVPGAFNILLFHQNLEGYMISLHPLPPSSIPEGFDLSICGDIHDARQATLHGSPLLLPGSTVATQINKDACTPRAIWDIDTSTREILRLPLKSQREIFYQDCATEEEAREFLQKTLSHPRPLKPIIKIRGQVSPDHLREQFREQAILLFSGELESPGVTIEEQRLSVQESGKALLEKNLREQGLDPLVFEPLFELLVNKKQDEALDLLRKQPASKPASVSNNYPDH